MYTINERIDVIEMRNSIGVIIPIMLCAGITLLSGQNSDRKNELNTSSTDFAAFRWDMQHDNFFGLTFQAGISSALSSENIGKEFDLMIIGPEILFGIIFLEKGLSTLLEVETVKSINFTEGNPIQDGAKIPVPDLLITPRLLFLIWFGNFGIGWGSSFSMVLSEWTYVPSANFVYSFANLQLVIPIVLGDSRLLFAVVAELGLHWQNLRNTDIEAANIGFQGYFGGRLYLPIDST